MPECRLSTHPHLCKLWSIFEFFQYLLTVRIKSLHILFCHIMSSCASILFQQVTPSCHHHRSPQLSFFTIWRRDSPPVQPCFLPCFLPLTFPLLFFPPVCHLSDWFPGSAGWFGSYRGTLCLQAKTSPDERRHTFGLSDWFFLLWAHRRTACDYITGCLSLDRLLLCLLQRIAVLA